MITIEVNEKQFRAIRIAMNTYLLHSENKDICEVYQLLKQMVESMEVQ